MNSRQVDGIVISSAGFDELYVRQLVDSGVPVVLLMNREYNGIGSEAGRIYTGLIQGMKDCVKLMVSKGRKNLLYIDRISRRGRFSDQNDLRFRAFCEQMSESGLELPPERIVTGCASEQELFDAVRARLIGGPAVDGMIGRNDNMACIAMKAAQQCGLRVPEDVAVAGFDNSRVSAFVSPTLTSVEIDRRAIADAIITMLDAMIRGGEPGVCSVPTRLIEREST